MSLICITGHQGTGKSTILNQLVRLGYTAYGLDEEGVAGYVHVTTNVPSSYIPQGEARNLEWRKDNVWKIDVNKTQQLPQASPNKPTFYLGYAANIEDLWDICDYIIVLELDDATTKQRLLARTTNSFGKHPGEMELAFENSRTIKDKATSYSKYPIHYIDASSDILIITSTIEKIVLEGSNKT